MDMCETLMDCFLYSLDEGLRNGGGVGDDMKQPNLGSYKHYGRIVFDLSFFILVVVILLNIIFGIIIDTFA